MGQTQEYLRTAQGNIRSAIQTKRQEISQQRAELQHKHDEMKRHVQELNSEITRLHAVQSNGENDAIRAKALQEISQKRQQTVDAEKHFGDEHAKTEDKIRQEEGLLNDLETYARDLERMAAIL